MLNPDQQKVVKGLAEDKQAILESFRKKAATKVLTYVSLVAEGSLTPMQLEKKIVDAANGLLKHEGFKERFHLSSGDGMHHKMLLVWLDIKSWGEAATAPRVRTCPWDAEYARRNVQIALSLGNEPGQAEMGLAPGTVHLWGTAFKSIVTQLKNLYMDTTKEVAEKIPTWSREQIICWSEASMLERRLTQRGSVLTNEVLLAVAPTALEPGIHIPIHHRQGSLSGSNLGQNIWGAKLQPHAETLQMTFPEKKTCIGEEKERSWWQD